MEIRNTEEFNDFDQRLFTIQENVKEFARLENQHGAIFEKVDEISQIGGRGSDLPNPVFGSAQV
jgi:hypothetical protein